MGWSGFDSTKPTDTRRWDGADNDIRTNFAAIGSVFKDVDQYASLAAAIASIGSEVTTLSVSSSQTITANVTFPSTMTLRFHPGGVFVQDDAWTVTINGPLEAGLTQIFSGFAKGEVTFGRGAVQFVRPEWWQVNTTPGTTVMTTAMNIACNLSLPVRLLPTHYIASVIHDTGTTSLRGPGGGSESSPTAAGLPMIEAENSGEYAWTERAVAAGASWGVTLLIEDVVVNGNSKDKGGFVFGHPTTYAAGYEALGRVTIQRCAFLACTRAIYHPWGNIGNRYYDNLFRGGDYGVFVEKKTGGLQHIGANKIEGGEFNSQDLAAIYIDNSGAGIVTGQFIIKDVVLQGINGFAIFVEDYSGFYGPLTIDGCWFETNASVTPKTIESVSYTTTNMRIKDTDNLVIYRSNVEDMVLINSHSTERNCSYLSADNLSSLDSTSSRDCHDIVANVGNVTGGTVHSYSNASGSNDLGDSDMFLIAPRTHDVNAPIGGTSILSDSYAGHGRKVFTGTASVKTETVADGVVHSTCGEITVTASRTEFPSGGDNISYTSGKWYAYSAAFKMTSATQPTTLSASNTSQFFGNQASKLVQNEWVHLGGIQLAGATSTSAFPYIVTQAGNTLVLRIADLQVVQFDTFAEAKAFFNSKGYFGVSSEVGLLSCTTLDVTSTGQTTLYTVPTGRRLIIDKIMIVAGAVASPTAQITFGERGSATDFLAAQTMGSLAAQYDTVVCRPIPNATPVKLKSYPAASIIEADVTTADPDGGTDNQVFLYGTLY